MKKLVFDIGASAIKYALMDDAAKIYEKGKVPTPKEDLEHFLLALKSVYEQYQNEIDGIAISAPGTIDSELGKIYAPGGIAYNENVNLVEQMHTFTTLPIALENDGKSAALAETWKGNLQDCKDGVVLVLGTGIGGGIIKDKQLWKGSHLFAGEFSYVLYGEGNDFHDVWAMNGSTTALIMEVAKMKGLDMHQINGEEIFALIEQKDEDACQALRHLAHSVARGMFNIQCMLDPEKILIGGGISQQPILCAYIQEALDALYKGIPFDIPKVQLDTCKFYNDSNLIGALYNFLSRQ